MADKIWHLSSDFLKLNPKEVLNNILADDQANRSRAELELSEEIKLLDDAITLCIF